MKYKKIALLVAGPMIFYGSSVLSNDKSDLTGGSATKNFISTVEEITFINFEDSGQSHAVTPRNVYTTLSSGLYTVNGCWSSNDSSVSLDVVVETLAGKTPIPELIVSIADEDGETTTYAADACKNLHASSLAKPLLNYSHALDKYDAEGNYLSRISVTVAGT